MLVEGVCVWGGECDVNVCIHSLCKSILQIGV
jgi:hypothetical protein